MNKLSKVIAIDGPSGSGKSTIAKIIAEKLELTYLDTGAMFRAIAWQMDNKKIAFNDEKNVEIELSKMNFEYSKTKDILVSIDDVDLTQKIREHHVSKWASEISQSSAVRAYLKMSQRDIASKRPSILEGRDIGTVIFPDAALKYFLTADPKIRAERRFSQLKEKGIDDGLSINSILEDIIRRDETDRNREIAPLVKAGDAKEVDTTSLSVEEVVKVISEDFSNSIDLFR